MRGSRFLVGALLGAAAFIGVPGQAAATAPDPYSGTIDTDCRISVPAHVGPGERVVITIRVAANSPTPPTGEVDLAISTRPGRGVIWTKTVQYNGGTQQVVGPNLPNGQNYSVSSRFRPDDNVFQRCSASVAFAVDAAGGHNGPGPGGGGPDDGTLPDTGGPALLWLLLGVSLVGGGAGTVVYARRRTAPAIA